MGQEQVGHTMRNFFWSINSVNSNVWSVVLICISVALILRGHDKEGAMLLTGAFGVFKSGGKDASQD
jgi:hypothetical protein